VLRHAVHDDTVVLKRGTSVVLVVGIKTPSATGTQQQPPAVCSEVLVEIEEEEVLHDD
jgi:hypothetical protein